MDLPAIERRHGVEVEQRPVHSHAHLAGLADLLQDFRVLPLAAANEGSEEYELRPFGQGHQGVLNLLGRLLPDWLAAAMARNLAQTSEQQPQIIVDFGRCGDGAAGIRDSRALVDANDRSEAVNRINIGPLQLVEELPGIDGEAFDILPLPLGKQRVERQTTLARAAGPGNDDQLATGNVQINVLEVVRSRAADSQAFGSGADGSWRYGDDGHDGVDRQQRGSPTAKPDIVVVLCFIECVRRMTSPGGSSDRQALFRERLGHWIGPFVAIAAFIAAIALLYLELKDHSWREILDAINALPRSRILLAIGLTALNYSILSGYDGLAVWYLRRPLRPWRVMLVAFVGYAMSHNLTWMLGGTASRFRLYLAWGFSPVEVVKIFALIGLTFWTGFCFLAGIVFLIDPMPIPGHIHLPLTSTFWLGPMLLGLLSVYLLACAIGRPVVIRGVRIVFPPVRMAIMQGTVASCDLLLQAAVAYTLLPSGYTIGYWQFANAFLLAIAAAVVSHVPGGAGVL